MMISEENRVVAIIWDYDGTLVDSARKNMNVTIEVLRHFDPNIEDHIPPALQSYDAYQAANHRYRIGGNFILIAMVYHPINLMRQVDSGLLNSKGTKQFRICFPN